MATVRARSNSTYQIRVFCGLNSKAQRIDKSMTWTPPEGMTQPMRYKGLSGFQQSGWNRGCSAFVPTVGWMFFIYINIQWR